MTLPQAAGAYATYLRNKLDDPQLNLKITHETYGIAIDSHDQPIEFYTSINAPTNAPIGLPSSSVTSSSYPSQPVPQLSPTKDGPTPWNGSIVRYWPNGEVKEESLYQKGALTSSVMYSETGQILYKFTNVEEVDGNAKTTKREIDAARTNSRGRSTRVVGRSFGNAAHSDLQAEANQKAMLEARAALAMAEAAKAKSQLEAVHEQESAKEQEALLREHAVKVRLEQKAVPGKIRNEIALAMAEAAKAKSQLEAVHEQESAKEQKARLKEHAEKVRLEQKAVLEKISREIAQAEAELEAVFENGAAKVEIELKSSQEASGRGGRR